MSCEACLAAAAALTHMYRSDCEQCTVRAIAGGPDYYHSAKAGELLPAYRTLLKRVFGDDVAGAHRRVRTEAERMAALAPHSWREVSGAGCNPRLR